MALDTEGRARLIAGAALSKGELELLRYRPETPQAVRAPVEIARTVPESAFRRQAATLLLTLLDKQTSASLETVATGREAGAAPQAPSGDPRGAAIRAAAIYTVGDIDDLPAQPIANLNVAAASPQPVPLPTTMPVISEYGLAAMLGVVPKQRVEGNGEPARRSSRSEATDVASNRRSYRTALLLGGLLVAAIVLAI